MPMNKVSRHDAVTREELDLRLCDWLTKTGDDVIGADASAGVNPWIFIRDDGVMYELNADTSRRGVENYLVVSQTQAGKMWHTGENRRVMFGHPPERIVRFALYRAKSQGGAEPRHPIQ